MHDTAKTIELKAGKYPYLLLFLSCCWLVEGCKKNKSNSIAGDISLSFTVNSAYNGTLNYQGLNVQPVIRFNFTDAVKSSSITGSVQLKQASGAVPFNYSLGNNDKTLEIIPQNNLKSFTSYTLEVQNTLQSATGGKLINPLTINLRTGIDSTDKFPQVSDSALLDLVQRQTFKYFWDFGHPVSGLARERNTSGEIVTSGGSGFGIMALLTGIRRNFISRQQGLARMQTIISFLKNKAQRFHGAYPHWLNGTTGAVVPFSTKDNGADLVETSYLIEGLLCARQFFDGAGATEAALRNDINSIWQSVEWSWFRKNNENTLYWHWSPDYNWEIGLTVRGWNEALVTYVLAASAPAYAVPKIVYDNGWAQNGAIKNGANYYGYTLPLGPQLGGPLFFEHYSFLGINPNDLTDQYANYQTQTTNHTKINYEYCKANPKNYYGFSDQCWGLTASDIPNGYTASSPTNDAGVIAPTAALSSFPYTPTESMKALKFFYYKLGDKLWGDYGFVDAFDLQQAWFSNAYLAIDQGPIVVMVENYRSGLLWNLFMSCPEIKNGMTSLGFHSPHL